MTADITGEVKRLVRARTRAAALAMVLAVSALPAAGGCGGSSAGVAAGGPGGPPVKVIHSPPPSRGQTKGRAESPRIQVTIPALLAKHTLPPRFTCYGSNVTPPVRWGPLPPRTKEVALFVVDVLPLHEQLVVDWAVTGLKPKLHEISAGKLPGTAVVGRNSHGNVGYTMCLPSGFHEDNAVVDLFALPRALPAKRGFDSETLLHQAALAALASGVEGWVYVRPRGRAQAWMVVQLGP